MTDAEPEYDPDTLRELAPDPASVPARVAALRADIANAPDDIAELLARADLVELLRVSGDLDAALDEAVRAVDRAGVVGTPPQQHMAQLRLATVHQWRGDVSDADAALAELGSTAARFGPVIAAATAEAAGRSAYDRGEFVSARDQFARALALLQEFELPTGQITAALDAVNRHLKESPE